MDDLLRVLSIAINHVVREPGRSSLLVLDLLMVAKVWCITAAVHLRLICAHVPLFVIRDVTRVRPDSANNGDQEIG